MLELVGKTFGRKSMLNWFSTKWKETIDVNKTAKTKSVLFVELSSSPPYIANDIKTKCQR